MFVVGDRPLVMRVEILTAVLQQTVLWGVLSSPALF